MALTRTLIAIVASRLLAAGQAQTAPDYRSEVYVARPEFTESRIAALSRDILKRQQAVFISVWFFTSEADAADYRSGKISDHISYDVWRRSYERLKDMRPMARLVSIGDSSVLLLRGADGAVTRAVLSGRNPLEMTISGGREVHILDLVLSLRNSRSKEYRVNVFAWTAQPLEESLGREVIADLKPKIPFEDMILAVRNDPWFLDDPFFPVFSPFDPEFLPPLKAQYVVSPTLTCVKPWNAGEYKCGISARHD